MKKILMVGSALSVKGGMTSVINMYEQAGLFKSNIEYLPSHRNGSLTKRIFFFARFLCIFLRKILFEKQISIVHIHSSYRGSFFRKAIVIWIAYLLKRKTIFHLHGSEFNVFYNNVSFFVKQIISKTLNVTSNIIVLSSQWKHDIEQICSNENIHIIYNPIIVQEQNSFLQKDPIKVLFMGLICKRKGAYDIIKAAREIKQDNIIIDMYGNGDVIEVKKEIKKYSLEHIIKVHDWISGKQIIEVYKRAHIYILPSYNEGLPMSILEAMSHGLPIISTDIGGIPEAVNNGRNGFLISPGDHKALATRILQLSKDFPLIKKMGRKSHEIARAKFSVNNIISSLHELYARI